MGDLRKKAEELGFLDESFERFQTFMETSGIFSVKKPNVTVKAKNDLLCGRIAKKTDILCRVEKGFERYNNDPVFKQIIDAIAAGADPIEIIVFCLDNLKR